MPAAAGLLLVVSLVFLTGRHNPAAENPGFAEVDSGDDFLQLVAVKDLEQRVEVARDAAAAAARIGRAFSDGRVSGQRRLGGHVAGLVSEHASPAFLGLLIPATLNVS